VRASSSSNANVQYDARREEVLAKLKQNEYISQETFEAFVQKKLNARAGKRMLFPERNVSQDKKELLDNYLSVMREKERAKLEYKKKKIEEER
jgi:membrane peptidoglycan carboxypeptidase